MLSLVGHPKKPLWLGEGGLEALSSLQSAPLISMHEVLPPEVSYMGKLPPFNINTIEESAGVRVLLLYGDLNSLIPQYLNRIAIERGYTYENMACSPGL